VERVERMYLARKSKQTHTEPMCTGFNAGARVLTIESLFTPILLVSQANSSLRADQGSRHGSAEEM
jgi:hypothetical protein